MPTYPSWTQLKTKLLLSSKEDLLNLLKDLYQLNTDNKVFLASRLGGPATETMAEPYKRAIRQESGV